MHLLIPFAAPLSEAGRQAAGQLSLPSLQKLLVRLVEVERDAGDEWSLSTPHERAHARALGLTGASGLLPWAAWQAPADGIDPGDLAWGLLTPSHWHLGTDQVSLIDPESLALDEASSRAFFDAVQELFTSLGYAMHYGAPLRWYLAHESLRALATASIDRVIGRNVDAWLGTAPALQRVRRVQSELQMVLYTHPLNDAREAQGLLPLNSFWLSGCGVAQVIEGREPGIDSRLRSPALGEDWAAWVKAWETLDEGPLAELLTAAERDMPLRLTLCGERSWAAFESVPRSLIQRLRATWSQTSIPRLLETL